LTQQERIVNRKVISAAAMLVLALTSPAALAVAQAPAPASSYTQKSVGPTVAASKVGIKAESNAAAKTPQRSEPRLGAGRNVAMMVVGGAALIIGAIIGGGAGLVIAVAGAGIGLYGLYNFVQ
jgi:predicted phage tail protein